MTDNRGVTTMAYEPGNDRVSSVTDPVTGATNYTYGLEGQRLTMTLPGGGTWTYGYSGMLFPTTDPEKMVPRLTSLTDDQGRVVNYTYVAGGAGDLGSPNYMRFNQTFNGSGGLVSYCETDYTLDTANGNYLPWLTDQKTTWNYQNQYGQWQQSVLAENKYSYDNAGDRLTNQVALNGISRTEVYGYDELNRLTSVVYGDGGTQTYSFDNMGNRLDKNDSVTGNEGYTYNAANMLLARGTNSYTNDQDGNTLTGGGRANTWDSQNRLVNCVYGSNTSSYVYGADGLRHQSTVNGTTTDFALDGQFFVRELQGGAQYATYLTGPTGPLYRRDATGETLRWYIYDGLGSVLGEVDGSGNLDATRTYGVYGLARSVTGTPASKHAFVGRLGHPSEDETGLTYMRARYMDPTVGRFLSEDPDRYDVNYYSYCQGSPTTWFDPSGRCDENLESVEAAEDVSDELSDVEEGVADMLRFFKENGPPKSLDENSFHAIFDRGGAGERFADIFGHDPQPGDISDMTLQWDPSSAFRGQPGSWLCKVMWHDTQLILCASDDGTLVSFWKP